MNNPIRILLVDDNSHFLAAARDFLELQESFRVIGAIMNGGEAVSQSNRLEPDVILLDLNLAGESGLDLIPLFKRHMPKTKIIVLTIMQDENYRAAAMQAGADAFVHKSEISKTLISVIVGLAKTPATAWSSQPDGTISTRLTA
ncbi:MAG: response regulator [Chloroflexota bacterium]